MHEKGGEAFEGKADDVGPASGFDGDDGVVVLDAVSSGLALPEVGVEIGVAFLIGEGTHTEGAGFGGAGEFVGIGEVEDERGDDLDGAVFLKADHAFGVGAVGGFIEEVMVDGADGVGSENETGLASGGDGVGFVEGEIGGVGARVDGAFGFGFVDVGGIDLEGVAGTGE